MNYNNNLFSSFFLFVKNFKINLIRLMIVLFLVLVVILVLPLFLVLRWQILPKTTVVIVDFGFSLVTFMSSNQLTQLILQLITLIVFILFFCIFLFFFFLHRFCEFV